MQKPIDAGIESVKSRVELSVTNVRCQDKKKCYTPLKNSASEGQWVNFHAGVLLNNRAFSHLTFS